MSGLTEHQRCTLESLFKCAVTGKVFFVDISDKNTIFSLVQRGLVSLTITPEGRVAIGAQDGAK